MFTWIYKNSAIRMIAIIAFLLTALLTYQYLTSESLKAQLVRYLASRSDQRTAEALEGLRAQGWLRDPALHNLDLSRANYASYDYGHDLSGFDFTGANFYAASLPATNLRETVLRDANFQQAALHNADLYQADLRDADLRGVYLTGANLEGANLEGALLGTSTLLPSYTYWTPDVDMTIFTDPNHPSFWRSTNENSPAYDSQVQPDAPPVTAPQPTPTVDLGQSQP